ncbi:MAG: hypothetical protein NZL88_02580 [Gaiellaceae bacterium]|nr:hypothetical protein [Gaiellaceae bacterium]
MRRRILVGLAAAVVVAALGGGLLAVTAGGSDVATEAETQQAVSTARNRVDFAFQHMARSEDLDELLVRMTEASEMVGDAASELGELRAPDRYAPEVSKLTKALAQLSVDLDATASDLKRPELLQSLLTGARGISFESWEQANAAIRELNRLGLAVEELERY